MTAVATKRKPKPTPQSAETYIPPRPLCPCHGDTMRCGSAPADLRYSYYYCRVVACMESAKRMKPAG